MRPAATNFSWRSLWRGWGPGFFRWWIGGDPPFPLRLALLALGLALLVWGPWAHSSGGAEGRAPGVARRAQDYVVAWRKERGIPPSPENDPWHTGLVGEEMTVLTTTLGDLAAKRTACDPRWVSVFFRWFKKAELSSGDRITVLSSGSFPGFLLSTLVAAEAAGLRVQLLVSLGSSSWGANREDLTLLDFLTLWRRGGFVTTRAEACTLGGGEENARDMPQEGVELLREAARRHGVPVLEAESWRALRDLKAARMEAFSPRLVVQIGGGMTSLGEDPAVLEVPPGLLLPEEHAPRGDGLLAWALERRIPAVHLLDVRTLARQEGVPFDAPPDAAFGRMAPGPALGGLLLFALVLGTHRRWSLEPLETFRSSGD